MDRFASVFIRRSVLPPAFFCGLMLRLDRMVRILRNNVSLRLGDFVSVIVKVSAGY